MEQIREAIEKSRNLKESTIKTYLFNLNKLHRKMFDNEDLTSLDFLLEYDDVIDVLADYKLTTRKTFLSAIVVALSSSHKDDDPDVLAVVEKYRTLMLENIKAYNAENKEQNKTPQQNENWVSMKELKKVVNTYKREVVKILPKITEQNFAMYMGLMQKWLVASLYVLDNNNPPLRLDFAPMEIVSLTEYKKLSQEELNNNNYLVIQSRNKKFFSLGKYKTKTTYGIKNIAVGSKLNSVLNIYLKVLGFRKYLLYNSKGEPMTPNGLTKFIQKTFEPTGKSISVNMLRHIYISEYLTGPTIKEKEELGEKMGHSTGTQELYKKT